MCVRCYKNNLLPSLRNFAFVAYIPTNRVPSLLVKCLKWFGSLNIGMCPLHHEYYTCFLNSSKYFNPRYTQRWVNFQYSAGMSAIRCLTPRNLRIAHSVFLTLYMTWFLFSIVSNNHCIWCGQWTWYYLLWLTGMCSSKRKCFLFSNMQGQPSLDNSHQTLGCLCSGFF